MLKRAENYTTSASEKAFRFRENPFLWSAFIVSCVIIAATYGAAIFFEFWAILLFFIVVSAILLGAAVSNYTVIQARPDGIQRDYYILGMCLPDLIKTSDKTTISKVYIERVNLGAIINIQIIDNKEFVDNIGLPTEEVQDLCFHYLSSYFEQREASISRVPTLLD